MFVDRLSKRPLNTPVLEPHVCARYPFTRIVPILETHFGMDSYLEKKNVPFQKRGRFWSLVFLAGDYLKKNAAPFLG